MKQAVEADVDGETGRSSWGALETRVVRVAEPIAAQLGVSLVSVRYAGSRIAGTLRLTIDKPGGVTLEDCTRLSRALGHALDVEEPIEHRYTLEVSSPGLDRPLNGYRDFEGAVGRLVRVKTRESWDGPRIVVGRLKGVDAGAATIEERDGGREWSVPFDAIAQARLEVEW
ncbi:MAG: ribosome maturation factor RimP [Nitrospirota bacterium]